MCSRPLALIVALVALAGCSREIAAGLDESDANRGVVSLAHAGIDAEKVADPQAEGRFRLVVGRDDATSAIAVLSGEEIPRARQAATKDSPLVTTPEADRAARVSQMAQAIERTLASVDGVLDARVHLDVPPVDPLAAALAGEAKGPRATASVLVRHRGANPPIGLDDVRRLVAGAVAGLAPEAVAVVAIGVPLPSTSADRQIAWVGPIGVSRGSLPAMRAVAAGVLGTILVLSAALVALALKLRRSSPEADLEAARAERGAPR